MVLVKSFYNMSQGAYVTAAVTTAGVLAGAYCVYHLYNESKSSQLPTTWKKVGTLNDIFMYPVKSCAGIQKTTAECTFLGLKDGWLRDRILMVVDDKYRSVTARVFPKLLLVKPTITNSTLTLKSKDMEPLHLNLEEIMIVESRVMNCVERITYQSQPYVELLKIMRKFGLSVLIGKLKRIRAAEYPELEKCLCSWIKQLRNNTNIPISGPMIKEIIAAQSFREANMWTVKYPVYECGWESKEWFCRLLNNSSTGYGLVLFRDTSNKILKFQKTDTGAFADEVPFNLINQASIDDLNTRLKGIQVTHKHFRTNFLLSGAQPYEEDNWKFIKIGENIFEVIRPCSRCIMTTNNPETGVRDSNVEPLETLRSYRQETDPEMRRFAGSAPRMGVQMVLRSKNGGIVSVNDTIYVA